jgi:mRNA interferase MazF
MAGRLERGEIRLLEFPPPNKQRPVVVLTNSGSIPHLSKVTVAAITSTVRGIASDVVLDVEDGMKHRWAVNLHNLATVDQPVPGRRLAQLSPSRLRQIRSALSFAMGCAE